jgi:RNA polymerase sigma-54 factor
MSFKPSLSNTLQIKQGLGLVLTPQLRQRIEMLQMNKLELNELVNQQMNENPVLEELSPEEVSISPDLANVDFSDTTLAVSGTLEMGEMGAGSVDHFRGDDGDGGDGERPDFLSAYAGETVSLNGSNGSTGSTLAPDGQVATSTEGEIREPEIGERDSFEEIDFGSTFEEYLDPGYRTRETEVRDSPSFDQFLSAEGSLADYLNWQLRMTMTRPEVHDAAEAIIGNLNDDGFLEGTLAEVAAIGSWPLLVVEEALAIVQQFDPTGVGARDLRESLIIQLDALGYGDRLATRLVRDCFAKLHNHKLPELAKDLGLTVENLLDELKIIRRLEPHPGRKFAPRSPQYIEPEVYIEKIDEDYLIRFNDDGLPQLRINRQYRQMMENKETSKETRDYIRDRFRSAVDLLKNIEHRKQTIYKVCERIVERQREFLDQGVEYIKPMMLKDISEDIGMHLSTVSRVVNGKYAHTPQGVIELRRFFTEGMTNDDGEEISTRIIKLKIKKMIEVEDSRSPLTDDQIAAHLAREGQKLSRRTVAKYRDQMKIPGSRERRQVV